MPDLGNDQFSFGEPNYLGDYLANYCGEHAVHDAPHLWYDNLSDATRECEGVEHADNGLLNLVASEARAIEAGYSDGDVNHVLQPIIGVLRMHLEYAVPGEHLSDEQINVMIFAMRKACRSELAWLAAQREAADA